MIGTLKLMPTKRWAIVNAHSAPYEITSGEVFHVEVAGVLRTTRMEFAHGDRGSCYYSVDGYAFRNGLRVATYTGR